MALPQTSRRRTNWLKHSHGELRVLRFGQAEAIEGQLRSEFRQGRGFFPSDLSLAGQTKASLLAPSQTPSNTQGNAADRLAGIDLNNQFESMEPPLVGADKSISTSRPLAPDLMVMESTTKK